jgi:hypothetical protein
MDEKDQDLTGKIMDVDPALLEKVVDWAARVFPAAAQRRMQAETKDNESA